MTISPGPPVLSTPLFNLRSVNSSWFFLPSQPLLLPKSFSFSDMHTCSHSQTSISTITSSVSHIHIFTHTHTRTLLSLVFTAREGKGTMGVNQRKGHEPFARSAQTKPYLWLLQGGQKKDQRGQSPKPSEQRSTRGNLQREEVLRTYAWELLHLWPPHLHISSYIFFPNKHPIFCQFFSSKSCLSDCHRESGLWKMFFPAVFMIGMVFKK